jgi:Spy/CpxP family protein refolding chaperone
MKTWVAVGAVLLSAGSAFAQQQDDPVERSVQRLKDQLTLTEEQIPKVREILKKQHDDVKALLTDAQKTTYDQGGGARGNRPGGNNNGNGNGNNQGGLTFGGGAWLPPTADLKTQISLTDDQVTKINEIRDAVRQEMRTFFQNRGRRGGGNQGGQNLAQDFQAFQEKSKTDTTKKIMDLLSDEQKAKFEEALKAFAANQPAPQDFAARRAGSIDDRVTRVMDTLKVEEAKEADAIKGLVKKVMESMDKLDAYQRDSRTKIDDTAKNKELSDAAVGDKISEIMKGHVDIEKELAAARKALTDVVTNRQELELLRRGILR